MSHPVMSLVEPWGGRVGLCFCSKGLGLSIPGCRDTEAALFEVQAYVRCRDAKPYAPGLGLSRTFWCSFVAMMAGV